MYSIGDNVIYGSSGVMTIVDIRRERILSDEREYYVLKFPRAQAGAFTFVPVDNEKLTSMMRPLPSKEEIMEILHSGEIASEEEWVKDNRIRTDRFKQVIERGAYTGKDVEKYIQKTDKRRSDYYHYYTGKEWSDARNYDLCLNSECIGDEGCVRVIKDYIRIRFGEHALD